MHHEQLEPNKEPIIREILVFLLTIIGTVALFCFLLVPGCAHAEGLPGIPEETIIKCILGEARGEGYAGMLAHGEAIRNRGTLKGVNGCRVKFWEPERIWNTARKAWRDSVNTNTARGADHWGGIGLDDGWIRDMRRAGYVQTARIGNTVFFKK